jgi:hypothetical protein
MIRAHAVLTTVSCQAVVLGVLGSLRLLSILTVHFVCIRALVNCYGCQAVSREAVGNEQDVLLALHFAVG